MSGLFPLALYLLDFLDNARRGVPADSLWMCHVANLLMAAGALARLPLLTRAGLLWSIAGLPFWIRELFLDPTIGAASYVCHLGGFAFALYWLKTAEPESLTKQAWPLAWLLFLAVRLMSGLLSTADLNVNASMAMRDGFEHVFSKFWQYWLFSSMGALVFLVPLDRFIKAMKVSRPRSVHSDQKSQ